MGRLGLNTRAITLQLLMIALVACVKSTEKSQVATITDGESQSESYAAMVQAADKFIRRSVSAAVLENLGHANATDLSKLIKQVSVNCQMRLSIKLREDLVRTTKDGIPVAVDFWVERKAQAADDSSQLGSAFLQMFYVPDQTAAERILKADDDVDRAVAIIHATLRSMLRKVLKNSPLCAGPTQ
jgi:hypothetical protein